MASIVRKNEAALPSKLSIVISPSSTTANRSAVASFHRLRRGSLSPALRVSPECRTISSPPLRAPGARGAVLPFLAQALVSEPSPYCEAFGGLAADYHSQLGACFPQFTRFKVDERFF